MNEKEQRLKELKRELEVLEIRLRDYTRTKEPEKINIDKYNYLIKKVKQEIEDLEYDLGVKEDITTESLQNRIRRVKDTLRSETKTEQSKALKETLKRLHNDLRVRSIAAHPYKQLLEANKVSTIEIVATIQEFFLDAIGLPVEVVVQPRKSEVLVIIPNYAVVSKEGAKDPAHSKLYKDLASVFNDKYNYDVGIYNDDNGGLLINLYDKHTEAPVKLFTEANLYAETPVEEATKSEIEAEATESNIILDDKFIWVFAVLDKNSEVLQEDIYSLDKAIDAFVNHEPEAVILVAYPYIDPKPGDPNVELIFADNPGPVIIYDTDKATKPKEDKEKALNDEELELIVNQEKELKDDTEEVHESVIYEAGGNEVSIANLENQEAGGNEVSIANLENQDDYDIIMTLSELHEKIVNDPYNSKQFSTELLNLLIILVKMNRADDVLNTLVQLAKAAEGKAVRDYIMDFGAYIGQRIKQIKARIAEEGNKDNPSSLKALINSVRNKGNN